MTLSRFGGILCHVCVYCGLPAEMPGEADHVCRHRDFRSGGGGHRAHSICCANHMAGRDGIHEAPCLVVHQKTPKPAVSELSRMPARETAEAAA